MSPSSVWLIAGASGVLGHELCRHLAEAGRKVVGLHRDHPILAPRVGVVRLDLGDAGATERLVAQVNPTHVIHAAGMTNVDACEKDEAGAVFANATTAATLAAASARHGATFAYVSTDHLWDGTRQFVTEDMPPCPLNAYGRSKAAGERESVARHPEALVVRTNFFGRGRPWKASFSDWVEHNLRANQPIQGFADVFVTPIATRLFVPFLVALIERGARGTFNLAGGERVSKYDLSRRIARQLLLPQALVEKNTSTSMKLSARRPLDMSLCTDKIAAFLGSKMPDIDESLAILRPARARP